MNDFDENLEEKIEEDNEESSENISEDDIPEESDGDISEEDISEGDIEKDEEISEETSVDDIDEEEVLNGEITEPELEPEIEDREEFKAEKRELTWHEQVLEYKKDPLYWDEDEEDIERVEGAEFEIGESPEEEAARIERQVREFHKCQIEAALYASGKPLTVEILSTKLEIGKREVGELVNELAFDYLERSTALVIAQVGDRYQMQIKPEYTEKVSKFAEGGAIAEKYLRTLTIIALKQPILKSLVIKLRGTGAYDHVKYLLENALIDAVKKGRSQELTTTDKYAEMFGLPKDKQEMKRVMIAQLGIDEDSEEPQSGPE
jgi:segregation and condensation protein B